MCGIYGTTLTYGEHKIQQKLARMQARGPDQSGIRILNTASGHLSLGHNRLSIIDLDPRSNQPFTYNNVHVVFNGEIYNFESIKSELLRKGYSFKTSSDTEVLCAAYLEYGNQCVQHLNGMFAFVIFDEAKQLLFGARDRLGQKPFYYFHQGKDFEFASQISCIQLHNDNLSVSSKSISQYLTWGTVPDPSTIIAEVKKLQAGHLFTFALETGEMAIRQYWDLNYEAENDYPESYDLAKDELKTLITDSVKLRLFADVPVGVFLSGGIDSSLIAALATETSTAKIKTFSVKFNERNFDESKYAQMVAAHLGTEHHLIECNYEEGLEFIQNFTQYYDEPFADSSAIPCLLLSKYTREHVTVALSGDAGDENFGGYHRYNWMAFISIAYRAPRLARVAFAQALKKLPHYKLRIMGGVLGMKNENDAYLSAITTINQSWTESGINSIELNETKYLYHTCKNIFERIMDFDIKTYLNWDINSKVDRASMAFSLETRVPFLDYRVVEFARRLPTEFKFQKRNQKRILKDILFDLVPKKIFDRPKSGFTMPFKEWFRQELKEYVLSELDSAGLDKIPNINKIAVENSVYQHMDGTANNYSMIWRLLVLKQWLDRNPGLAIK